MLWYIFFFFLGLLEWGRVFAVNIKEAAMVKQEKTLFCSSVRCTVMGLLNVKQILVLFFLFKRTQIPAFSIYKWLWNSSKYVCGCLPSLVNVILRRGTSAGLVTSLMCCLLLYFGRLMAVAWVDFLLGKAFSLGRKSPVMVHLYSAA